tara:strand:- start:7649 stop:8797 length:1149 start_codon:yes stop_codon:yes gene_type:complete
MKILMVSMNSIHFRRWSEQLRDSGHELYWFDIRDQESAPSLSYMTQITGWKKGFLKHRGRSFLKQNAPKLFAQLSKRFDTPVAEAFETALVEIQPDLVHSFALYVSCGPILEVMQRHDRIKWLYSSWGSDLYYFQNIKEYLDQIKEVLPSMDYLMTDCQRDAQIAVKYGFKGNHLGVFPGGGGFNVSAITLLRKEFDKRNVILVKGNQNRSGRALVVLKAIDQLGDKLKDYKVVVFGAEDQSVLAYGKNGSKKHGIPSIEVRGLQDHDAILAAMCSAKIYIGNSNSDGMPNTLLEAICCGAFPIQSNPGGATGELIKDGTNGLLIEDCEDVDALKSIILKAINADNLLEKGVHYNDKYLLPKLEQKEVRAQVLKAYDKILRV